MSNPDADCRFGHLPFDYLVNGQRRKVAKETPMETLLPLIAAAITLAALSVGEAGARVRRTAGK